MTNLEIRKSLAVELFKLPSVEVDGTGVRYCPTADLQHLRVKPYESTGDGMLEVIEAMRANGFKEFDLTSSGGNYGATFKGYVSRKWRKFAEYADTASMAVAKAALAAIRSQK